MTIYAGLDISDKSTHICVMDGAGKIVWRGVCATDPEVLAFTLRKHARDVTRVVLETGSLSAFLYHGLIERGVPVVCICARHAKKALSARERRAPGELARVARGPGGADGAFACARQARTK